jgi:hypothetical protein
MAMKTLSLLAVLLAALPAAAQCDRDREFVESLSKDAAVQKADVPKVPGKPAEKQAAKTEAPLPDLKACDETANKKYAANAYYGGVRLFMVTDKAAYYQHNDCDICDEVDRCELATGEITHEITAHSVSCSDLDKFKKSEKVIRDCRQS